MPHIQDLGAILGYTEKVVVETPVDPRLAGRLAKCTCGRTEPSAPDLAFFEFQGEGSKGATEHCGTCGFYATAHPTRHGCKTFVPHGAWEFDRFYCGCRGWD